MNYKEIREFLGVYDKEPPIYMPNEIFEDFRNKLAACDPEKFKTIHIPFCYSFYYLTSYLYRYAKYDKHLYTNDDMKNILGYNSKKVDYLIKKNGLLDQLGYTRTEKDFPLLVELIDKHDGIKFTYYSEPYQKDGFDRKRTKSRKYNIKYPVKAFYRTQDDEEDNYENGTFYEIDNTHAISGNVFAFCMGYDELGIIGFYIYSYIKYKNNFCRYYANQNKLTYTGYDVSIERLAKELSISVSTLKRYLDPLKKYRVLTCTVNQDYIHGRKEEDRRPHTYHANEFEQFSFTPMKYIKAKNLSVEEYQQLEKLNNEINEGMPF